MKFTPDEFTIIHAALAYVLHGDEGPWEKLSSDLVEQADDLLASMDDSFRPDEETDEDVIAYLNQDVDDEDDDDDSYN